MKRFSLLFLSVILIMSSAIYSCKPPYTTDAAGMEKLENDLKEKFGQDAYYTYISYLKVDDDAYAVNVQVSQDKESFQQEQWIYDAGSWNMTGPMTMQISANTPGFYKFQINDDISVKKLGVLIEKSIASFKSEKNGQDPILMNAVLNSNNTVTDENTKYRYTVILKDKNDPTTHSYTYGKDGSLLNSN